MVTETLDIITNINPAVVPYSNLLANMLTVLWGCVFYGFYRIVSSLFHEYQPAPRVSQLMTLSLLAAMISLGLLFKEFLPFTGDTLRGLPFSLEKTLPLPGIFITFVILAVLVFRLRKKQCSFWLKLGLVVLIVVLSLFMGCLAMCNSFVLALGGGNVAASVVPACLPLFGLPNKLFNHFNRGYNAKKP